jgi:malate dehydrogenase (oxaloacetate-decarboxylating)
LGNIGPEAALPVMEGKAMLLKEFADVDGFPICLNTQDPDEIIETVKRIAPVFGAINLEDIAAPQCFEIEKRLKAELDIPVFHDDQHGTAAVMTAAFINALKLVNKAPEEVKVVFNGVGAAGNACKNMLLNLGVKHIIGCDRNGILSSARQDLNSAKQAYLADTNPHDVVGTVYDAIVDADVFVGLSAPNILSVEDIQKMNSNAIVFAMANPTPEIMPEIALPHVAIMATGRSDYPNQINNLLAFPGIFRGTLDAGATDINDAMNLAAAKAIAELIDDADLAPDYIVPSVFNPEVAKRVAQAVKDAARESGIAKK